MKSLFIYENTKISYFLIRGILSERLFALLGVRSRRALLCALVWSTLLRERDIRTRVGHVARRPLPRRGVSSDIGLFWGEPNEIILAQAYWFALV